MSRKNSLKPLKDRINDYQQARRQERIRGRATVAAQLIGANNQIATYFAQFYGMGLFKRILWFVFGYKYVNTRGAIYLAILVLALALGLFGLHKFVLIK